MQDELDSEALLAQRGDRDAASRIIERLRPHARSLARRLGARSVKDAEADAVVALIEAISTFDPARDRPFVTYAQSKIRWAVAHHVFDERQDDARHESMDEPLTEDGDSLHDRLANVGAADPERLAIAAETWRRIMRLPERTRSILLARLTGRTEPELAADFGITRGRVGQIVAQAVASLAA